MSSTTCSRRPVHAWSSKGSSIGIVLRRQDVATLADSSVQETERMLVESGFGEVHSIVVSPLAPTIVVGTRNAVARGR
jgi:hypothetical protein